MPKQAIGLDYVWFLIEMKSEKCGSIKIINFIMGANARQGEGAVWKGKFFDQLSNFFLIDWQKIWYLCKNDVGTLNISQEMSFFRGGGENLLSCLYETTVVQWTGFDIDVRRHATFISYKIHQISYKTEIKWLNNVHLYDAIFGILCLPWTSLTSY